MRKQKKCVARPANPIDPLVKKVCDLSGCSSFDELFLRASMACCRKKLAVKRAASACKRFLKEGRVAQWARRILQRVYQGRLTLPELKPSTA